ncbi:MAG: T9SS type A sorting domain-containing protein [Psychroserpens sp.]|nr:T9SS type A sorting domain-containing protein [Psychroserpens sp.]
MKKKLLIFASVLLVSSVAFFELTNNNENEEDIIAKIKAQHEYYLENSPFKETKLLPRAERKALGLPPNAFNEQMWEMNMDPQTGKPMPERTMEVQRQLQASRQFQARGAGGDNANPWVDRGPNDQGGRTRGIMFDPNDVGNANPADDWTRVFAGGVSGGIWVNDDITDANSSWTQLNIQANISVTCIISDPNDSNVFYIGSGESFTTGDAVGRGIWKSEDAGITWTNIFGGYDSFSVGNGDVNGIFYVNDIVARDVNGSTELYAAIASAGYGSANSPNNFHGLDEMGVYKSTDDGATWTRFDIRAADNTFKNPCDLEIDINNNIWFTTTTSPFGSPGGEIYRSTDGITFTEIASISGAARTELEVSQTNANLFWVAANRSGRADLFFTNNAFATLNSTPAEPDPIDTGQPNDDYSRFQAFYNLPIEADENNVLYVGGIDLYRSEDFGISWTQMSKWSNNNLLGGTQVPLVHADQHAIVFRPGTNGTEAVFANDGGVYYSPNVDLANPNPGNTNAIQARNRDFNTIQFYYGDINQVDVSDGDDMAGGTQDNGTQMTFDAAAGANPFFDPRSGDGAYTEISNDGSYLITSFPGQVHIFSNYPAVNSNVYTIVNANGGDFINQAELDDNRNVLYTNSTAGANRRIGRHVNVNVQAILNTSEISNALLNAEPSAFKINPHSTNGVPPTATATLVVGLKNGYLLKIENADVAPQWSDIGGPNFIGSVSDIEFGQDENEIFVTMHNYGVQSVWYTNNGGANWTSLEGNLPDIPVKCVLQNPLRPQEIIIGTELGVWACPDITVANPNWVQSYNGMSDVTVLDLDLRAFDNTILATTHGRGMFTSQFTAGPLSIVENQLETNLISVFPTISNGNINIATKNLTGDASIRVYDINGQKVFNTKIELSNTALPINLQLNAGMYFVNITKDNVSETKKIIIK